MLIAAAAARVIAAGSTLAAHSTTLALHTQHTAHTAVLRQRVLCAVVLAAVAAVCCGSRAEAGQQQQPRQPGPAQQQARPQYDNSLLKKTQIADRRKSAERNRGAIGLLPSISHCLSNRRPAHGNSP
jgi:hypothetical protein